MQHTDSSDGRYQFTHVFWLLIPHAHWACYVLHLPRLYLSTATLSPVGGRKCGQSGTLFKLGSVGSTLQAWRDKGGVLCGSGCWVDLMDAETQKSSAGGIHVTMWHLQEWNREEDLLVSALIWPLTTATEIKVEEQVYRWMKLMEMELSQFSQLLWQSIQEGPDGPEFKLHWGVGYHSLKPRNCSAL